MRITILGTAAWEGIPALFCDCPTCVHARANGGHNIRKRTAALINNDLLIDFGPDLSASAQQYRISLSGVETLLVTHAHEDHWQPTTVVPRLPDFCPTTPAPLNIYGPGPVTGSLRRNKRWAKVKELARVDLRTVRAGQSWYTGKYRVTAVPANHAGSQMALLYIVDDGKSKLFYATDTGPLSGSAWRILVREAPYNAVLMDETMGNANSPEHQGMRTFLEDRNRLYADDMMADGAQFVALHFSHQSNPPHADLVTYFKPHGVAVAYDGMVLEV
ncbi:MAG: MBL fold metallo-hydrolase [Anaerolineae bacterium]|nr:MBL fold metallo-hydrolase [Anaerolineae bacterium]